ncbi:MAG TPA: anthranilate phosphoribosyltransferase [Candidatus Limnocylindrales bacterium]|nr:anthranilate phosphoribosyltransferase [Candidatus Limnocylindrales bacterium]
MMIATSISDVVAGKNLSEETAYAAMDEVMNGETTDAQIACFITALRMKGETSAEITGFARAIRARAIKVNSSRAGLVDTCGTGGDLMHTFNISTTAAFVTAACGLPVAKHGNRSVSSRCGSADVLESLGIKIELSPKAVAKCIDETGIGFLFAPAFHKAMKHAVKARKEIGIRTVFNILGPLVNPAGATIQLIGVYDPNLTEILAEVLSRLDAGSALIVHGSGGLDEISTLGPTKITQLKEGVTSTYFIEPEMVGIPRTTAMQLRGGSIRENAAITLKILEGEPGPKQDIVAINAAAALFAAGMAKDFAEGVILARGAIYSGEAMRKFKLLLQYTNDISGKEGGAG